MHRSLRPSLLCSSLLLGLVLFGANQDATGEPKPSNTLAITKVNGVKPGWPEAGGAIYPTIGVRIVGQKFGASQGKRRVVVEVGGKRVSLGITSWSDTSIAATMPSPQALGILEKTGSQAASFSVEEKGEKDYSPVGAPFKGNVAWHNKNDQDGDGVKGIAMGGTDCDEQDHKRFPDNAEVADFLGHDEDCDPNTFGTRDHDADGHTDKKVFNIGGKRGTDCDDARNDVKPGQVEACNNRDDNCNGLVDEELLNCPH